VNISEEHLERIKSLGYTDAEGRFLYLVAVHSGYFTMRQFLAFAGAKPGFRSNVFAQKLLARRHAAMHAYAQAGPVYHLFSCTFYGQIEKDDLRNRRRHSFDYIRTRLVLLDFVLAHPDYEYLETEPDKLRFFCDELGIAKDRLPKRVYVGKQGSEPTTRYFVDKFPMFFVSDVQALPRVVTLSFVDGGVATSLNFESHLRMYQPLYRELQAFRFLFIARKEIYFWRAEQIFRDLIGPDRRPQPAAVLRYFEIRKKWDNKEYIIPVTEDFEFLTDARVRFKGEPFESLYQKWRTGYVSEGGIRAKVSEIFPDRPIRFEAVLVGTNRVPVGVSEAETA
jgi:hypothetical protein